MLAKSGVFGDEKIYNRLVELIDKKMSRGAIATTLSKEFGLEISSNAVAGKRQKILVARKATRAAPSETQEENTGEEKPVESTTPTAPGNVMKLRTPVNMDAPIDPDKVARAFGLTAPNTSKSKCFCGGTKEPGSNYCQTHRAQYSSASETAKSNRELKRIAVGGVRPKPWP